MAKLTIILDTRKANAAGLFPIKLRISNNNTSTTISTGCFCAPNHFTGKPEQAISKSVPFSSESNIKIKQLYLDYATAINDLERDGKALHATAASIKDRVENMRNKETEKETTFTSEMAAYIEMCDKPKTAKGYIYSNERLHEFFGKKTIYFDELTFTMLDKFDRWMSSKGLAINTRGIVFRNIRTVFNYAIKADKVSYALYPFHKFKIKKAKKEKDFLTAEQIHQIANLQLKGQRLNQARDFFMLSFYLCGINPTDLYNMHAPARGKISFVRQKIEHKEPDMVHYTLPQKAIDIINLYKGEKHMLRFVEKHVYDTFKSRVGKDLKTIGEMIGKHIYMYMARYSWATIADSCGVPHDVISKALGHTDSSTAERYYISFDWSKVDRAIEQVIEKVTTCTSS